MKIMTTQTYRVVWRAFLGGSETLASGLTMEEAHAELETLPALPPMGGSYGLEIEEPHPAGDAPTLGGNQAQRS